MERSLPPSLSVLRLYGNPWRCDCRLRWLRRLLPNVPTSSSSDSSIVPRINWHFGDNTPKCTTPELMRDIQWRHLTVDQFACPSQIVTNSTTSVELRLGSNVSVECLVFGDPEPVVTWMRGASPVDRSHVTESYVTVGGAGEGEEQERRIRSVLTLRDVTRGDVTDYKCVAVNPAGRSEVTYKVWIVGDEVTSLSFDYFLWPLAFGFCIGLYLSGFN